MAAALLGGTAFFAAPCTDACTRVVYHGLDSLYVIGRSLDWRTPIPTNIYVYPAGIHKRGSNREGAVEWTSRYGAVYAVGYDGGITEGMNEKGLSINALFCKGTVYDNDSTRDLPPMSMSMFVAWLLDLNSTTDEVVDMLRDSRFTLGGATFDGGTVSQLHWGITDASGATAILEFDHGTVKIYDPGDIRAMTNDPDWPQMKAIVEYWRKKGGIHTLPGTVSSPDRCVRADFFANHVEPVAEAELGMAITRTVLHNSCVPYTYTVEGEPNLSSTQWCSYSNLRDLQYGFEFACNYGTFYIDLNKIDLRPGAKIWKLDTTRSLLYTGCVNRHLEKSEGFNPMY